MLKLASKQMHEDFFGLTRISSLPILLHIGLYSIYAGAVAAPAMGLRGSSPPQIFV